MDCVEDCLRTTRCRSINYYQGAHFCQTNFENRTTVPELYIAKPGWIYTDIEDWDKKIAGACSRSSCRINEKCIPQPFDQFTCVISDCGVPKGEGFSMEHVREWDAIGISRGIHITCADKHNQLGSERFVCRSNGTWRADLSCPEKYNDYIKHLPEGSPDIQDAKAALEKVEIAAKHSEEAMRKIFTLNLMKRFEEEEDAMRTLFEM
uniref:Sushi domain-containing protein n=1 Tax=Magallana gigas TaxID=29159 RepID=K1RHX4_MAGGI